MGFLSNLFKDKKKDHSRNTSEHEHHNSHRDATATESKSPEASSQQHEVAPAPKAPSPHMHITPHAEHSKEIPQRPNEQLPSSPASAAPQSQELQQAPQNSHPMQLPQHDHAPQTQQNHQRLTQAQQRPQTGLKPAYCYTGGGFSETISREEAMLAKQYNFAATEDRAHADVAPSATRRNMTQTALGANSNNNNNIAKNAEFDSLFSQFVHETKGK
jgi:hypothetical protein